MNVGGSDARAMHQAGLAVRTDMQLHAEVPFVALLGLMHFRIAALVFIPVSYTHLDVYKRQVLHRR